MTAQDERLLQDARSAFTLADDLWGLGGDVIYPLMDVMDDMEERSLDGTERLQLTLPIQFTAEAADAPFPGEVVWVRDGPDVRSYRIVRVRTEIQQAGNVFRLDCAGARYDLDTAGPKIENRLINWEKRTTLEEWLEILLDGMPSGWTYDTTDLPDDEFRMATGGQSRLAVLENLARLADRELYVEETSSAITVSIPEQRGSRDLFRITDVESIRSISYEFDQRDEITHLIPQGSDGRLMGKTQLTIVATGSSGRSLQIAENIYTIVGAAWNGFHVGTMSDGSDAVEISNVLDVAPLNPHADANSSIEVLSTNSFGTSDKLILFQPDGTTFLIEVPGQKNPRVTQSYDVDDAGNDNLLENPLLNGTVTSNVPEGWTRVGTPTITRNTQEWNYGGASVKVVASAGGQGLEQTRSDEEGGSAYNMGACAWLFITSGKVRVQAIQTASSVDTRFPSDSQTGQGIADETDRWIRVSVPGQPGLVGGGIRVTSYDGAATFILDAVSPFIGSAPPHPEVGRFSHRLLLQACARMRQIQTANEPSINGAIIDHKRLAGDPPMNPGDDLEVWVRRDRESRYQQFARVNTVRTKPTVRGDTTLVLEHKVRAMDALLRPAQVPSGDGVPLLPNAIAIPQDEEGNAGGLTADQEALLDIVDDAFTDEGAIEYSVVRQDQSTAFSFMSGLFSGVGQDGDTLALPVVGTAVPLIEVTPARCVVVPNPAGIRQDADAFPTTLTGTSLNAPNRTDDVILATPDDFRIVYTGRIRIDTHNAYVIYRPYYIKEGETTRNYKTSSSDFTVVISGDPDIGEPSGATPWLRVRGATSPTSSQINLNTWHSWKLDVVFDELRAGDTVGVEAYRSPSSATTRLELDELQLGRFPIEGRMVLGANGISRSGFTLVGKMLYRSTNTLTDRSITLGLDDQAIGSVDDHEFTFTPYLGEVEVNFGIESFNRRVTVAVDVRDGSSAWREVARRTTIHEHTGSLSSVVANVAFTDTSLGIGDDIRIRLVSAVYHETDDAGNEAGVTEIGSVDIDATVRFVYAVGTESDIEQTMTPLDSDTLAWRSVHGESF